MQIFVDKSDIAQYLQGFVYPNNADEKERNANNPVPSEAVPGILFCVDKILSFPDDSCHNVRIIETYVKDTPEENAKSFIDGEAVLEREQTEESDEPSPLEKAYNELTQPITDIFDEISKYVHNALFGRDEQEGHHDLHP